MKVKFHIMGNFLRSFDWHMSGNHHVLYKNLDNITFIGL